MSKKEVQLNKNIIQEIGGTIKNKIDLGGNTHFNYFFYTKNSSLDMVFQTIGEDSCGNIFFLFYGKGISCGNIITKINHSNCKINVFIISIIQDSSNIQVNGDIQLSKNITDSQGHLLEKNIILGSKIRIKALPRLDVYSSNVQATHGVSIDKFDKERLFYINSRGLNKNAALQLSISGIIKNILNYFSNYSESEKIKIETQILSNIIIPND